MVLSTHSPRHDRMSRAELFDDKGLIRSMNSDHRLMGSFVRCYLSWLVLILLVPSMAAWHRSLQLILCSELPPENENKPIKRTLQDVDKINLIIILLNT